MKQKTPTALDNFIWDVQDWIADHGTLFAILFFTLLFSVVSSTFAEEKKPKIEYVYSLITWYDKVPPYTNEFIWKTERKCLEFRASINGTLESYKDDPKFGWIGECTKRERP